MAYRDILVSMDRASSAASRAAFAADMAGRFGARLIGAFARSQLPVPFMPPDAAGLLSAPEIQRIYDEHDRLVQDTTEQARQTFEAAAAAREVTSDWHVLEDFDALAACARRTDLLVVSADPAESEAFAPVSLVMAGGGPAVVLPSDARPSSFRRILVAWNGSREAARALHAAWPVIVQAEAVDVLIVSRGGLYGPEGLLQRHFEHHEVKPNVILDDSEDAAAGRILRRQVDALSPDMVVMGLYSHTRIRELVLGGASREMLAEPKVPLFVCH